MIIHVLVVDDHDLARAGIRGVLEDEADIKVVAEARNGVEAIDLYLKHRPNVVLMDVRMPAFDGVQATQALLKADANAHILVVSSYDTEEDVFRAIDAGARGYLLKESRGSEIVTAVRAVATGGRYVPAAIAARLDERAAAGKLTGREHQVLVCLHQGLSNQEIAAQLGLSPGTIRMYVSSVLDKVGAKNRTEAVSIAIKRGLIRDGR